jgi:pyruvate formate-lyase activating enzyme-like uncharacterized protein
MLGNSYKNHRFYSEGEAKVEIEKRSLLWKQLKTSCNFIKNNNKIHYGELSPGCLNCVEGRWTCLFVGGICPNGCYFCPIPQNEERAPNADGIEFNNVQNFISYLKKIGTKGVSFSGGEPFRYLDIVKEYCTAIRKEFSSSMYIWCYTSGLLVTEEALKVLKDAGLDELRFNIAAFDYDLSKVSMARKYIPKITVEIPAIPEDYLKLQTLIKDLVLIGVDHLNLHEMNITNCNEKEMSLRKYKINRLDVGCTIFESEMTILKLMDYAAKNNIKMPINSCKFFYKDRITTTSKHMIAANLLELSGWEEITRLGLIRSVGLFLSKKDMNIIKKMNISKDTLFDKQQGVLLASPQIIFDILNSNRTIVPNLGVAYTVAIIDHSNHKKNEFTAERFQYTDMIDLTIKDLKKLVEKKYDQIKNSDIRELEVVTDGLSDPIT